MHGPRAPPPNDRRVYSGSALSSRRASTDGSPATLRRESEPGGAAPRLDFNPDGRGGAQLPSPEPRFTLRRQSDPGPSAAAPPPPEPRASAAPRAAGQALSPSPRPGGSPLPPLAPVYSGQIPQQMEL